MRRKNHTPEFKAQVALEALKGLKTLNELASDYGVHPNQISQWKRQLQSESQHLFTRRPTPDQRAEEELKAHLYQQIGPLKVELDWVKKKLPSSIEMKRALIDVPHPPLSIRRQCALLGLPRSSFYYSPAQASAEELVLMRRIDEQYTRTPFYGSRKMVTYLGQQGCSVNRKRVQRLMRPMGLEAIAPGKRTSTPHPGHKVYPYLLRGLTIDRSDYVGCTDITYIRLYTKALCI